MNVVNLMVSIFRSLLAVQCVIITLVREYDIPAGWGIPPALSVPILIHVPINREPRGNPYFSETGCDFGDKSSLCIDTNLEAREKSLFLTRKYGKFEELWLKATRKLEGNTGKNQWRM